ncbi:MAG: site-specific DNA-methyltransferase, partial [Caldilineaceae bacterium]|nr:site-specific DNA-methyltransferase [Caldilineaceae bacterium]
MEQVTVQDGESLNVVQENFQQLKTIFPEAFTEDGVDFAVLRQLLGDAEVLDEGEEKFGLNWHGKKKARQIALTPSTGTLRPCPEESVDWDSTQNLFIEGDNLEVLKLLQKSYAGRVKMIYIDPPYNTGKEFIYPDNYQDNLDTYLRYTGQKSEEGLKFSSNTESSGRYHTNWLNMMYPRLKLAKNLLRPDGVICISIDEIEVGNLRTILDEIFGEENRVTQFIWNSSTAGGIRPKHVVQNHEYALFYTRDISALPTLYAPLSPEAVEEYKLEDGQGKYREKDFAWRTNSTNVNQKYLIECPDGTFVQPPEGYLYRFIRPTFEKALVNNDSSFDDFA